ncbi:hypothetical protein ACS0TY_026398 [Phlomoides rotata]
MLSMSQFENSKSGMTDLGAEDDAVDFEDDEPATNRPRWTEAGHDGSKNLCDLKPDLKRGSESWRSGNCNCYGI